MLDVVGVKLFRKMNFSANFRIDLAAWYYRNGFRLQQQHRGGERAAWVRQLAIAVLDWEWGEITGDDQAARSALPQ